MLLKMGMHRCQVLSPKKVTFNVTYDGQVSVKPIVCIDTVGNLPGTNHNHEGTRQINR